MNQDEIWQQIAQLVDQYAAIEFSQKTFDPNNKMLDFVVKKIKSFCGVTS